MLKIQLLRKLTHKNFLTTSSRGRFWVCASRRVRSRFCGGEICLCGRLLPAFWLYFWLWPLPMIPCSFDCIFVFDWYSIIVAYWQEYQTRCIKYLKERWWSWFAVEPVWAGAFRGQVPPNPRHLLPHTPTCVRKLLSSEITSWLRQKLSSTIYR